MLRDGRPALTPANALARAARLLVAFSVSCLSVQDFGDGEKTEPAAQAPPSSSPPPSLGPSNDDPTTWRWEWANPAPTGNALYAINGTSDDDIWVAGDDIIAHWNGKQWDRRRVSADGTRYFAIGVRSSRSVWVAGGTKDKAKVLRFDGETWTESYPFAGAVFTGFSHGGGDRLFAMVDLGVLELSPEGSWRKSETGLGLFERGSFADVWVTPSNDAWAITTGGSGAPALVHLAADSQTWDVAGPDLPEGARGLSISGAGAFGCAFYGGPEGATDRGPDGLGFLFFDQKQWHVGVRAEASPFEQGLQGATSACMRGGVGYIAGGREILEVSLADPVERAPGTELRLMKHAAWSFDGRRAYVVGDHGLFLERPWDARKFAPWNEPRPTIRNELHDVDVGLDGAVLAVDSLRSVIPLGGEVLSWEDRWKALSDPVAHVGPSLPVAVTVIGGKDAWVASDEDGRVGVTHFTGAWSDTTLLKGAGGAKDDALAMWAPAANDVWLTGRERCPEPQPDATKPCPKAQASFAAHFNGAEWTYYKTQGAYLAVHGTATNDVWFAGDGVAHWDGRELTTVAALGGRFAGVWSSVKDRVWLWGETAVLFDGVKTTPIATALNAGVEWKVAGIAESTAGEVFVLTSRRTGTTLLRFDRSRTRLVEQVSSDLVLRKIRGRQNHLWAIGEGGASLRFTPPALR